MKNFILVIFCIYFLSCDNISINPPERNNVYENSFTKLSQYETAQWRYISSSGDWYWRNSLWYRRYGYYYGEWSINSYGYGSLTYKSDSIFISIKLDNIGYSDSKNTKLLFSHNSQYLTINSNEIDSVIIPSNKSAWVVVNKTVRGSISETYTIKGFISTNTPLPSTIPIAINIYDDNRLSTKDTIYIKVTN